MSNIGGGVIITSCANSQNILNDQNAVNNMKCSEGDGQNQNVELHTQRYKNNN